MIVFVRGSFVPSRPIRALRGLTRISTMITRERSREACGWRSCSKDAGIKLSSVTTDITGVSGRRIREAVASGEKDPAVLADMPKARLRKKIPALAKALIGTFTNHHVS